MNIEHASFQDRLLSNIYNIIFFQVEVTWKTKKNIVRYGIEKWIFAAIIKRKHIRQISISGTTLLKINVYVRKFSSPPLLHTHIFVIFVLKTYLCIEIFFISLLDLHPTTKQNFDILVYYLKISLFTYINKSYLLPRKMRVTLVSNDESKLYLSIWH